MAKKTKKFKERFYRKGLHFSCIECGNCCTKADGVVSLTVEEAQGIAEQLALPYPEFLEKYCEVYDNGETLHLRSRENGDCIFLIDERCSVYLSRPQQCRTFPFWPENLKSEYRWQLVAAECPGIGQGRLYTPEEIESIKNSMRRNR